MVPTYTIVFFYVNETLIPCLELARSLIRAYFSLFLQILLAFYPTKISGLCHTVLLKHIFDHHISKTPIYHTRFYNILHKLFS